MKKDIDIRKARTELNKKMMCHEYFISTISTDCDALIRDENKAFAVLDIYNYLYRHVEITQELDRYQFVQVINIAVEYKLRVNKTATKQAIIYAYKKLGIAFNEA